MRTCGILRRLSKISNAPLTSGPLSVTTCMTAPYRQSICSQKKRESALAVDFLSARPSDALDKSSRAATMYLYPFCLGINITSTWIFENNVAGVETVNGISTHFVLWI